MPDIRGIIRAIDEKLERTNKHFLTPPDANKLLARKGLLKDSEIRPGLPLRNLLRSGKIPHAYQEGGKGSHWRIPHSGREHNEESVTPDQNKTVSEIVAEIDLPEHEDSTADTNELKAQIESARNNYRPDSIKYLLVAEAPPDSVDRFFYYPDVKDKDWLFLGVMEALYPQEKAAYLNSERNETNKHKLLQRFQQEGFFLIDYLPVPKSLFSGSFRSGLPDFQNRVESTVDAEIPIILIKVNVYDTAFDKLNSLGYNVIDERISFPSTGNQKDFQAQFESALTKAGYFN